MTTSSRYVPDKAWLPELYWISRLNYFHEDSFKIALVSTKSRWGALGYDIVYRYFQYKTYFYNTTASLRERYVEKEKR